MCDLIAYAPHPDDAELFCGGTLVGLSSKGYRVGVVDLTEGERGTRGTPEKRAKERDAASKVLGLALREGLELPDMGLVGTDAGQLETVVASIRSRRPKVILAPHWEDRHPDHVEASKLVTGAAFLAGAAKFGEGAPFKPTALAYYQGRFEMSPSFVVDISEHFERKMEAIRCYASQFSPRTAGEPETEIADPLFIEKIRARARHYGAMIGVEYGEPFLLKDPVGIADAIELLARGPGN